MMVRIALAILLLPGIAMAGTRTGADAPEKAADKQDKVICKSFSQIGSLVATNKVCKTKREWEYERATFVNNATGSCAGPGGAGGVCSH